MFDTDKRLASVRPSRRQLEFQKTEFYAFVHFTVNTFTDREWGDGTESPEVFAPLRLDAEQWCRAIADAGMRGLILTCKHHDGFCLWPSRYTSHSVALSPCKKDVVKEVSAACRKYGLKFGVYLSPWDRHEPTYGTGKAYDDYFVSQLTELLTGYGDIFCVWFDGACGEGAGGKKQYYDWERYYSVIRKLQPDACINVCGPDIRWCGNEAGQTRPAEWSVLPKDMKDTEKVASLSQQSDDAAFRARRLSASDLDLGSREKLKNEKELIWYPAEVNTSIRPGWFWHKSEDDRVRSPEELFDIYLKSVGGNATFLLNIPPTDEGLFHENDVRCLKKLGELIRGVYGESVAASSVITPERIELTLAPGSRAEYLILQEDIRKGQLVESFTVLADGKPVYEGTVIGYKRIVRLGGITPEKITVLITAARDEPDILTAEVYTVPQLRCQPQPGAATK